jgi:hypothetical protein
MWRRRQTFSFDPDVQVAQERRAEALVRSDPRLDLSVHSLSVLQTALPSIDPSALDDAAAYLGEAIRRGAGSGWWATETSEGGDLIVRWDRPKPWIPQPRVLHAKYFPATVLRSMLGGGPPESIADHAQAWIDYIRLPSRKNAAALGPPTSDEVRRFSWFRRRSP